MAHIVFAWEIGSGFGHLTPIAALGAALRRRGHRVSAVVPAGSAALAMLLPLGIAVREIPVRAAPARAFPLSVNYSANLLRNGYWHSPTALQRVADWQQILRELNPDLLCCDHAPAALLASRGARYARAMMGTGFTLPPCATPMPSVQPWFPLPTPPLAQADSELLNSLNNALAELAIAPLDSIAAIFDPVEPFLYVEAELDHYPIRPDARYWGSIAPATTLPDPDLPTDDKPLVFVYLPANNPFLDAVLAALQGQGVAVLAYIGGAPDISQLPVAPNIRYLPTPVDLTQLAPRCQLAITHGGTASASLLLKRGVPLLCCPQDLEKAVFGQRLVERGLAYSGNWFSPRRNDIGGLIDDILHKSTLPAQLAGFSARYGSLAAADQLQPMVDRCEQLL